MSDYYRDNPANDAKREKLDQQAIYSASAVLLERLQEHHSYIIPDRRGEFAEPVVVEIVEASAEPQPVEVCALPIENPVITIDAIKRVVCLDYGISHANIISNRRHQKYVDPRQVAMYLAKMLTLRSLPDIGRRFGDRDHTTVLHAVRKITKMIAENHPVAARVDNLYRLLTA